MNNQEIKNVIVIGSGPAGLTAAIYAARAELKPLVLAGLKPGGQLMDTTEVENFPGFINGIMGPELMDNMMQQAKRFGAEILQENAVSVDFSKKPFVVKTEKEEHKAKSIIIATGAEANWLGLPSEQRLRGKGVSACATCDGFFFKGKDVAVIGGGDSAMEEATFLTKFANKVIIVHRREEFKASKIMLKRAQDNPKISFVTNVSVLEVMGENSVEGLKVKDNSSGEEKTLPIQGMFLAIGHTPAGKIFTAAGVETDAKGYIKVHNNTRTNIEGVFVAGDVNDPRYRQAISAAGMGCMAALDVEKFLAEQETELRS
ncbi:MAG: thioredoxin-disulfide reductase [Candidatus Doudnabacteria bacterium]|nr:thioredoxin-disulfide reductase [Candidatus Doudnabacteria bacterium]